MPTQHWNKLIHVGPKNSIRQMHFLIKSFRVSFKSGWYLAANNSVRVVQQKFDVDYLSKKV